MSNPFGLSRDVGVCSEGREAVVTARTSCSRLRTAIAENRSLFHLLLQVAAALYFFQNTCHAPRAHACVALWRPVPTCMAVLPLPEEGSPLFCHQFWGPPLSPAPAASSCLTIISCMLGTASLRFPKTHAHIQHHTHPTCRRHPVTPE